MQEPKGIEFGKMLLIGDQEKDWTKQLDENIRKATSFIMMTLSYSYAELISMDFSTFYKILSDAEELQQKRLKALKSKMPK